VTFGMSFWVRQQVRSSEMASLQHICLELSNRWHLLSPQLMLPLQQLPPAHILGAEGGRELREATIAPNDDGDQVKQKCDPILFD
jgi:hypothetical protein